MNYRRETPNQKKKKVKKKVMKTRNMKTIISNNPLKKGMEKECLWLCHCSLTVFKAPVISFSSNAPHQTEWNHLPHNFTLRI
jgi:hypothetical protein